MIPAMSYSRYLRTSEPELARQPKVSFEALQQALFASETFIASTCSAVCYSIAPDLPELHNSFFQAHDTLLYLVKFDTLAVSGEISILSVGV